tara:strand:+ start:312 stop:782 length:471 start_codon:yes stop_codon:yes gene_type:complete
MTRDRELEELEQLYRSVVPDLREAAPDEVTAKVKHAAEAHLSRLGSGKVISIGEYRKTKAFWSGIGLAAGITLGVFLGTLGGSQVSPDDRGAGMVFMGQKQAIEAAKSLEGSGPEEWQKKIAEHALLGDMRTVEALSKEFNKRFPDYGKQPVDNDK